MTKKLIAVALLSVAAFTSANAGGILTNTNQNAAFLRNPARDAAIGIDGVYSNPAGVAFMDKGLHLSVNWQAAWQKRKIATTNPIFGLGIQNNGSTTKNFKGVANAPFIPSIQAAYNTGNWSFQFNFAVTGGGGKCEFANGLGSFEAALGNIASQLVLNDPMFNGNLQNSNINYDMNSYLQGSQYYFGFTLGAAYKISEKWSIYGGVRAHYGTASYKAKLDNIQVVYKDINTSVPLANYIDGLQKNLGMAQAQINGAKEVLAEKQTLVDAARTQINAAKTQLDAAYQAQMIDEQTYKVQMHDVLVAQNQINDNQAQINAGNAQVAANQAVLDEKSASVNQIETYREGVNLQSDQSGFSVAPIIGIHYHGTKLDVAAKYEFRTHMRLKNTSNLKHAMAIAAINKFQDGSTIEEDIPAMLSIGAQYKIRDNIRVSAGYHHFFDTESEKYNHAQQLLSGGTNEFLVGAEYDPAEKWTVSAGAQITRYSNTDAFINDMSFVVNSWSLGLGAKYQVSKKVAINAALFKTFYGDYKQSTPDANGSINEFTRTNTSCAVGVDFAF
ncbi:MAG: outer membrane beta-barrel protein [Prevotella sp.]|nr:outer membrane beta-barrel protein [Candidatus Prevotella equi]